MNSLQNLQLNSAGAPKSKLPRNTMFNKMQWGLCAQRVKCVLRKSMRVCVISDHNKNTRIAAGIKIIIVRCSRMVVSA